MRFLFRVGDVGAPAGPLHRGRRPGFPFARRMKSAATTEAMQADAEKLAALLASAPRHARRASDRWLAAIAAMDAAPIKHKGRTARLWARRLGVLPTTVWTKRSEFRKQGKIALLDKKFSANCWRARRPASLPPKAIQHLRKLAQDDRLTLQAVIKVFSSQLERWQKGDNTAAIPGYTHPPSASLRPDGAHATLLGISLRILENQVSASCSQSCWNFAPMEPSPFSSRKAIRDFCSPNFNRPGATRRASAAHTTQAHPLGYFCCGAWHAGRSRRLRSQDEAPV